jgi:transposase InsO family protein
MDMYVGDIVGPFSVKSLGGYRYILQLLDVNTKKLFSCVLKLKSDTADVLITMIKQHQVQQGLKLKRFHSDNGGEFVNTKLKQFLDGNGTIHTTSAAYTPQHNSIVERCNRTMLEMVKTMLYHSNAPLCLWGEATRTACYILDRRVTTSSKNKTPYESWNNKKAKHQ